MKSMQPGGGGRFAKLQGEIENKGTYGKAAAGAIAATIGRKKYGKDRFQRMAARGRKRAS